MKLNNKSIIVNGIVILVMLFAIAPFIIFGENSIITIHDYLDSHMGWYTALKGVGFFDINTPTQFFNGLPSLYFYNYNFTTMIFYLFDIFPAFVINYAFNVVSGYYSMLFFLKFFYGDEKYNDLLKLISVAYAILPAIYVFNPSMSILPLFLAIFLKIMKDNKRGFDKRTLLLIIYPFFSSFVVTGIFLIGILFLIIIYFGIKEKKLNSNYLVVFVGLIIGYFLVEFKLFYTVFFASEPLNRGGFQTVPLNLVKTFITLFKSGHYHAATLQKYVIFPVVSLGVIIINLIAFMKKKTYPKILNISFVLIIFVTAIGAIYDWHILDLLIKIIVPPLSGFNWGRIHFFARPLWYLAFAAILINLIELKKSIIAYVLVVLQIGCIFITPTAYNDASKTILHHIFFDKSTQTYSELLPGRLASHLQSGITYKDFFAQDLFDAIKQDISYNGEPTVAFGYHPSVLTYNGFTTLDGYHNAYPLKYMPQFRELIKPELDINEEDRIYFDSWGGRCYLYSNKLFYQHQPTRDKQIEAVDLNIDTTVFREMGGVYILSRAEIKNTSELGIELINAFEKPESIYKIWAYTIKEKS